MNEFLESSFVFNRCFQGNVEAPPHNCWTWKKNESRLSILLNIFEKGEESIKFAISCGSKTSEKKVDILLRFTKLSPKRCSVYWAIL